MIMLNLIKQINNAWEQKTSLYNISPNDYIGYFNFRNEIVLIYNKLIEIEVA